MPRHGLKVLRRKPRRAAPGMVLFNRQGMPVSVRNAPSIRRIRKKAKRR